MVMKTHVSSTGTAGTCALVEEGHVGLVASVFFLNQKREKNTVSSADGEVRLFSYRTVEGFVFIRGNGKTMLDMVKQLLNLAILRICDLFGMVSENVTLLERLG